MGGVVETINKVFGGGGTITIPKTPDVEEERKKAEEEAIRKRASLADQGMSGTILGGGKGDDAAVSKKKLLGE